MQSSATRSNPFRATWAVLSEQRGRGLRVHSGFPSNRPATSVTLSGEPLPSEFSMRIWPAPNAPRTKAIFWPSGDQAHSYSCVPLVVSSGVPVPPVAGTVYTSLPVPASSCVKQSLLPSGDSAGW